MNNNYTCTTHYLQKLYVYGNNAEASNVQISKKNEMNYKLSRFSTKDCWLLSYYTLDFLSFVKIHNKASLYEFKSIPSYDRRYDIRDFYVILFLLSALCEIIFYFMDFSSPDVIRAIYQIDPKAIFLTQGNQQDMCKLYFIISAYDDKCLNYADNGFIYARIITKRKILLLKMERLGLKYVDNIALCGIGYEKMFMFIFSCGIGEVIIESKYRILDSARIRLDECNDNSIWYINGNEIISAIDSKYPWFRWIESIIEIDPNILIFLNIQIEKLKNAGSWGLENNDWCGMIETQTITE
ncbi:hypothetical protein H8356DRAFT_1347337 [Neocallimastix lanati (nom. inval.)]|nr:hypothetical protein H8356DRAFT_1347337 [Neocallimastix sp. JGI-2020a]